MNIYKRLNVIDLEFGQVYCLNSGHKDLVKFKLIRPGGEVFCHENLEKAEAYTSMLDQGSSHYTKDQWAMYLDSMGMSVGFTCDTYRQYAGGRCLTNNFKEAIHATIDQSYYPLMDASIWKVVKARLIGQLHQMEDDTQSLAYIEMVRAFYPYGHPHYSLSVKEGIESVNGLAAEDLMGFHQQHSHLSPLKFIVVGDFDQDQCIQSLEHNLKDLTFKSHDYPVVNNTTLIPEKQHYHVEVPEKSSIDVYWAHPIPVDRHHKDYLPLMLGIFILGGNFSARLMRTVRDEEGLTYGVYSRLAGMHDHVEGFWYVHATFSPALFDKGEKSIFKQINLWHQDGVNVQEFESRKQGIIGKHLVGTSTTSGLMSSLTQVISQSLDLDYVDRYPQLIRDISIDDVNRCIRTYIKPNELRRFSAGQISS